MPIDTSTKCSSPQGLGNIAEEGGKCKSQRIKEFVVLLCLLVVSEPIPINSHQHEFNKDINNGLPKWKEKKPTMLQHPTKHYRQQRKAGNGKGALSQGREQQSALQCPSVSPEIIHISNIIWIGHAIFRNTYVYTYMHAIKIHEKEVMNLNAKFWLHLFLYLVGCKVHIPE